MMAQPIERPQVLLASGMGAHDTHAETIKDKNGQVIPNPSASAGRPYIGITGKEIAAMVQNPPCVDKFNAQWVIPSDYVNHDARDHNAQRENGRYWFLVLDVDKNDLDLEFILQCVKGVCGDVSVMAYSTKSSKPGDRRWRAVVPVSGGIRGPEYEGTARAYYELLIEESGGVLFPDQSLSRPGQIFFLPNRGDHYESHISRALPLHLTPDHRILARRLDTETRLLRAKADAETARNRRMSERAARGVDAQAQPTEVFNERHAVPDLLEKYGYKRLGQSAHYQSPYQKSGSYATLASDDHWVSLSGSDADMGLGAASGSGNRYGDAFDLYAHFEHGGDFTKAVREYAKEAGLSSDWAQEPITFPFAPVPQIENKSSPQSVTSPAFSVTSDVSRFEIDTGTGVTPAPPSPTAPAQEESPEAAFPTAYDFFDAKALEPRRWIYGQHYLRGFVSVLASPGGIGKTSMQIVEALAIATGRPLLGEAVHEPCPVWLVNLEDPMDEMQRRILAAMQHYGITPDEIRGKLFVDAGREFQLKFAAQTKAGVIPNAALIEYLKTRIPALSIGTVFIDPFVGAHEVNENDNMAVNSVVASIREIADVTRCAIGLVHHTRKSNGEEVNIDSVRGAGSLIGAARAARVINKITPEMAAQLGIQPKDMGGLFRVDDGKANLAPPAESATYRRMIGVQIANGEWVGVAAPFDLPDEWCGMTPEVANDILEIIGMGVPDAEGRVEYYSARPQDPERWAGRVIMDYAFDNPAHAKNEGTAKRVIKQWLQAGLLEEFTYRSERQRKERKGLRKNGRVGEVAE